jgi:addiction module HigA family antidote
MTCLHPGITLLQQYIEPQKLSQNALARAIKVPPRRINEIIHGKRSITADTAIRLAIYFGGSATYWMHLQAEYEIEKIRKNINIQLSTIQPPLQKPLQPTNTAQPKVKNSLKKRIMR